MSEVVTILIADDHAILRSGLKLLLNNQANWEVVGEAGSGQEAVAKIEKLQPDVVLLDINMPDGDGLSLIPKIQSLALNTKILILTMHEVGDYLKQAIQSGAHGYVLKKAVDTELIMAIQAVLRGELYVHPAMTQYLLQSSLSQVDYEPGTDDTWQMLSEREFEVLKRVALGYTNSEIADELFLSPKTVETYRARGMEKLDLKTRAQLVKSAIENHHLD